LGCGVSQSGLTDSFYYLGGNKHLSEVIFFIFGLLFLINAVRNFFGEDDPDAPPP
jgi:hypothetical protein